MKEYFSKKYQKARLHFENFRSKSVLRVYNLAKRLDLGHTKREAKKQKQK